jgi:NitT/TauT family transport system substrate-binding protein
MQRSLWLESNERRSGARKNLSSLKPQRRLHCFTHMRKWLIKVGTVGILGSIFLISTHAYALEVVYLAIPTKSFQHVIYYLAKDRGYMEESGIDLKIQLIRPAASIQALMTNSVHFTLSGTSALIAASKGNAPLKVILAANKNVLQWALGGPGVTAVSDLRGKQIATPGVASVSTYMFKQILAKNNLNPDKDVVFFNPGPGNHLSTLLAGVADAAILGAEQRYVAIDSGMNELSYLGGEVKNSWGTLATSDRLIQEQPKLVAGFLKAALKSLRFIRGHRAATIAAITEFSEVDAKLAGRVYDDLINTFTHDGTVDKQTQTNDLDVISHVAGIDRPLSVTRAYDFSLVRKANRELTRAGWHP